MNATEALNKVCKWKLILSGRIWGTAPASPQAKGRADIFEKLLIMRAELRAMTSILVDAGVMTTALWDAEVAAAAIDLDAEYEAQFPGMRSAPHGMILDPSIAVETMKGWPK